MLMYPEMEVFPVTANTVTPPQQSPHLEYSIYLPRAGAIEIGQQSAAWISGNSRNRIARRTEAESVQSERRRFFSTSGH